MYSVCLTLLGHYSVHIGVALEASKMSLISQCKDCDCLTQPDAQTERPFHCHSIIITECLLGWFLWEDLLLPWTHTNERHVCLFDFHSAPRLHFPAYISIRLFQVWRERHSVLLHVHAKIVCLLISNSWVSYISMLESPFHCYGQLKDSHLFWMTANCQRCSRGLWVKIEHYLWIAAHHHWVPFIGNQ